MRRAWMLLLLVGAACDTPTQLNSPPPSDVQFSLHELSNAPRFIVVLQEGADPMAVAKDYGVTPRHVYTTALNGFSGSIADAARAGLMLDLRVKHMELDADIQVSSTQLNASWGLDRIDQRALPLSTTYDYHTTGAGVTAYILDTGIRYSHTEFGGRAVFGFDAFGGNGSDCHSHGTHVAGTVGGAKYGVAKQAQLVALRVLDCNGSGTVSGAIAGIDWILHNVSRPAVANMSFSAPASAALDDAIDRLVAGGVVAAVAAGNNGGDACSYSPARAPAALTVGATDSYDARASFSNRGACLDIFAPGVGIAAAGFGSDTEFRTKSGTSMASPHVAGAAALVLERYPSLSASAISDTVNAWATANAVINANSANARLLFTLGATGAVVPAPNAAPNAKFASACSALSCAFTDQSTDADGSVVGWAWDFGDGSLSGARNPTHSYATPGSYVVRLIATDDDGAATATQASVAVSVPPPTTAISLSAVMRKVKGTRYVDLAWSGATSTSVDIYRYNTLLLSKTNSGAHTDNPTTKTGSYLVYRVCESGTTTCSASVNVPW